MIIGDTGVYPDLASAARESKRVVVMNEDVDLADIVRYAATVEIELRDCVVNCHGWPSDRVADLLNLPIERIAEHADENGDFCQPDSD